MVKLVGDGDVRYKTNDNKGQPHRKIFDFIIYAHVCNRSLDDYNIDTNWVGWAHFYGLCKEVKKK